MRYPRAIEDLMEQNDAILIGLRYAMPLHDCADHFARNKSSRYSATKSARCSGCDDNGDSIIGDVTETPILEECGRSSVVGSAVPLSVHRLLP